MSKQLSWIEDTNATLRPATDISNMPIVLDLFAGCGGMALGFEASGFRTIGFEMDIYASETYSKNLGAPCHTIKIDMETEFPPAEIVIGGPPCQPFSVIGEQKGTNDDRNGFPAFIRAVEICQPKLFIFENVKGLVMRSRPYFDHILKSLSALGYELHYRLINAVEFGVPQNRERIVVIGSRIGWSWPISSSKSISAGDALGDLAREIPLDAKFLNEKIDRYIAEYERKSQCRPRDLDLSKPSRTVTCRNLYAMTGDMLRLRLPDGRRRMLTVREAARLQSFPDWFEFTGANYRQFQMIGNAVPPLLGLQLARQVKIQLTGGSSDHRHILQSVKGQSELSFAEEL